jgi:hypothetical protein
MREYGPKISPPTFEACRTHGKNQRAHYNRKVRVWIKTGGYCFYCERSLVFNGCDSFQIDHVTPKSGGGRNKVDNYVPACEPCNKSKGKIDALAWATSRGLVRAARDLRKMRPVA